ncbi:hypothetical protein DB346_16600 [Verrucomicrobia bacterium LW23]|nr:hypothetical protein DB346_16600 [Verrucomicrobia bacterium LW23]
MLEHVPQHIEAGDKKRALEVLNAALRAWVTPELLVMRSVVREATGDTAGYIEDVDRALELNKVRRTPADFMWRGSVMAQMGAYAKAEYLFGRVVADDPDNLAPYAMMGQGVMILCRMDGLPAAIAHFNRMQRSNLPRELRLTSLNLAWVARVRLKALAQQVIRSAAVAGADPWADPIAALRQAMADERKELQREFAKEVLADPSRKGRLRPWYLLVSMYITGELSEAEFAAESSTYPKTRSPEGEAGTTDFDGVPLPSATDRLAEFRFYTAIRYLEEGDPATSRNLLRKCAEFTAQTTGSMEPMVARAMLGPEEKPPATTK